MKENNTRLYHAAQKIQLVGSIEKPIRVFCIRSEVEARSSVLWSCLCILVQCVVHLVSLLPGNISFVYLFNGSMASITEESQDRIQIQQNQKLYNIIYSNYTFKKVKRVYYGCDFSTLQYVDRHEYCVMLCLKGGLLRVNLHTLHLMQKIFNLSFCLLKLNVNLTCA